MKTLHIQIERFQNILNIAPQKKVGCFDLCNLVTTKVAKFPE